jgi:hypothetical protein
MNELLLLLVLLGVKIDVGVDEDEGVMGIRCIGVLGVGENIFLDESDMELLSPVALLASVGAALGVGGVIG